MASIEANAKSEFGAQSAAESLVGSSRLLARPGH